MIGLFRQGTRLGALALLAATGCGGAGEQSNRGPLTPTGRAYRQECKRLSENQQFAIAHDKYVPLTLVVSQWPGHPEATLPEASFAAALASGEVKRATLFARGGLGKTRLAESLRGQVCPRVPTFLVDAKDVAHGGSGSNPLLAAVTKDTGPDVPAFAREMADGRLVFLIDGLDEVDSDRRSVVLLAIEGAAALLPAAQFVVLARPPVLVADYGWKGVDAHLTIHTLQCAETEAFIAQTVKDATVRGQFMQFLHRYGLDLQTKAGQTCTYTYLASFGDVTTLVDFHKKAMDPKGELIVSRAHTHEALVGARLWKELKGLGWTAEAAIALVDRMVRDHMKRTNSPDVALDMAGCALVVDTGGRTADGAREKVCEKVFQSALFAPAGDRTFRFSSPGIANLFLARWLEGQLAASGKPDCSVAINRVDLVRDDDIFRFLIAQPQAIKCLMPLVDDRCDRNRKSDQVEILDAGLPVGKPRVLIVAAMHAGYEATHWKWCTQHTIKSMDAAIGMQ